jgi:hypothetical protein
MQTMTAVRFGGVTRNGITFVEFEDGDTWCALGHVDKAAMAEAVNEWFRETAGSLEEPECFEADVVEHVWAVETVPSYADAESGDAWYLMWLGRDGEPITKQTPGSFAISLIRV